MLVSLCQLGTNWGHLERRNLLQDGLHQFGLWGIFIVNDWHGKTHCTVSIAALDWWVWLVQERPQRTSQQTVYFSVAWTQVPASAPAWIPTLTSHGDRCHLKCVSNNLSLHLYGFGSDCFITAIETKPGLSVSAGPCYSSSFLLSPMPESAQPSFERQGLRGLREKESCIHQVTGVDQLAG